MRDDEAVQDQGAVFAELSLGEINKQHPALVHERPETNIVFWLYQDTIEYRVGKERTELVLDRRDGIRLLAVVVLLELVLPKAADGFVMKSTAHRVPGRASTKSAPARS